MRTRVGNPSQPENPPKYMIHGEERRLLKIKRNCRKYDIKSLKFDGLTDSDKRITIIKKEINEIEKYLAIPFDSLPFDSREQIMKNEVLVKYGVIKEQ